MLTLSIQRQKGQRAVVCKALPRGFAVGIRRAHARHNGVMQVVPFPRCGAGHASHGRIGAIGRDHQRRAQCAAVGQRQEPVIAGVTHLLQTRIGQQTDVAVMQTFDQRILHHAVFDDVPKHLSVNAGSREMHLARAAAVPHVHIAVGADATRNDAIPDAKPLKNALTGDGQRTDPGFKWGISHERFDRQGTAIHHEDVQPTVSQRQRQRAPHHSGPDNQQICARFHALNRSRLWRRPRMNGVFRHRFAFPGPWPDGQTNSWRKAADPNQEGPGYGPL